MGASMVLGAIGSQVIEEKQRRAFGAERTLEAYLQCAYFIAGVLYDLGHRAFIDKCSSELVVFREAGQPSAPALRAWQEAYRVAHARSGSTMFASPSMMIA
jgi:hypothetical protein